MYDARVHIRTYLYTYINIIYALKTSLLSCPLCRVRLAVLLPLSMYTYVSIHIHIHKHICVFIACTHTSRYI